MGLVRATGSTAGSIYKAIGKPRIILLGAIIQLIAAILAIYFLIDLGIEGVAFAMTISMLFGVSYSTYRLVGELNLAYKILFKAMLPAFLSGFAMFGVGILFISYAETSFALPTYLLLLILLMIFTYIGTLYIFSWQTFQEIKNTIKSVLAVKAA
jgi:O-antigen/teichoic acid export membrane protein